MTAQAAIDRQTVAYEYETDNFDGTTSAPATDTVGDDQQFYVLPTESGGSARQPALGIFVPNDPSQDDVDGTWGNRWITWFEFAFDAPAPPGSRLEIYDPENDRVLRTVADVSSASTFYEDAGFLLPQGAALRVTGGGAGTFRYHITFLDPQGLALIASLTRTQQQASGGTSQADLIFSPDVAAAAGTFPVELGEIQRYDPTGLAANAITLALPAAPAKDDQCGIKEVAGSAVAVTVDGNGSPVESPLGSPLAGTQSFGIGFASVTYQYDGVVWRIV